ncbi:acyltransferase 3 [Paraburkholderia caribensis MBA4]|uniref:Acyltransferase 3 n=1 Tax=Paraburkholderia caribensis MBA4 TaxID=1323664 RepID=A0A0P0R8L9_9BURK|nr:MULTISPECIES: acyltransferase [Paraburkholderia]ALL64348.1 acyltransferase 3 [Paraburkholderia caribensis MBA4]
MNDPQGSRIDDIEVLRAFAVLYTIIGHVKSLFFWGNDTLYTVDQYFGLWTGVDLFFAISGFVIARDLLHRLENADGDEKFWRSVFAFWIRRVYRIWPTSWLWVLVITILGVVFHKSHMFGHLTSNLADFVTVVMQVANFHFWHCQVNHLANECGGAAPWWSLSLEEQFYLALPIAFFVLRKNLKYLMIAAVIVQIFIPRTVWSFGWVIRTDAICLGVLIAIFSASHIYRLLEPTFLKKRWISAAFLALMLFLLAGLPSNWDGKINPVPFSTGMVALVSAALVFTASFNQNYFIRNRVLKSIFLWIGTRSFALYLIHGLAMFVTIAIWRHLVPLTTQFGGQYTLRFLVTYLAILISATELNFRFIEAPLRARGRVAARRMQNSHRTCIDEPLALSAVRSIKEDA